MMASVIGYDGSLWLVIVLLALAFGLTGALYAATRGQPPEPARSRRTPEPLNRRDR
jgi:hypothetical protein